MSIFLVSSYLTRCHSLIDRKPLETFHLPWYSLFGPYLHSRSRLPYFWPFLDPEIRQMQYAACELQR